MICRRTCQERPVAAPDWRRWVMSSLGTMMAEEETLPLAPASGGTRKGGRWGRSRDLASSQVPK
uniref:Uncharacterized protein n=1 Tax=Setaria italica TaxID=4555 RepID=K3XTH6_SETIT